VLAGFFPICLDCFLGGGGEFTVHIVGHRCRLSSVWTDPGLSGLTSGLSNLGQSDLGQSKITCPGFEPVWDLKSLCASPVLDLRIPQTSPEYRSWSGQIAGI
jgi:hypothetical protein